MIINSSVEPAVYLLLVSGVVAVTLLLLICPSLGDIFSGKSVFLLEILP